MTMPGNVFAARFLPFQRNWQAVMTILPPPVCR